MNLVQMEVNAENVQNDQINTSNDQIHASNVEMKKITDKEVTDKTISDGDSTNKSVSDKRYMNKKTPHRKRKNAGKAMDFLKKDEFFSGNLPSIQITSRIESGAVVVSAECKVMADHNRLSALLTESMEDMARRFNESGTFIGHMKASMDVHTIDVFSLTDTTGKWTKGATGEITLTLAVILFMIEESEAAGEVESMLRKIYTNLTETGDTI